MADIISRLKLESGEFDSKIKRAGQELMAYSEHCRKTGLQMGFANSDAKEFAKALGNMQTTSTTARGKISELSEAFVNLRVMFKNMSDEEKNSQFGKNLSASLDSLKARINEAKKDLADVTAELNDAGKAGGGGLFGGGKLDGMLQVFGGNLMTKGAGMLAGLASEMGDMVKQGIELAKQGEGIRNAFERLGRGDILQGLREATHGTVTDLELMKAAVKFNDFKLPVEELGTMLAFAQQKAKDTGQSVDYMVESLVTGLGRKSLMILDNLGLSASEIKERMGETGDMTKAVGAIIREQMAKSGDYVETAADRATKADVDLKNAMEALGRTLSPLQEAGESLFTSWEVSALKFIKNALDPLISRFTEAGRLQASYNRQGGSEKVNRMANTLQNTSADKRQGLYNAQVNKFNSFIKERQDYINLLNSYRAGSRGEGNGYTPENKARIDQLFKRFGTDDTSRLQSQIDGATKQLQEYQKAAKQILQPIKGTGTTTPTLPTTPTSTTTTSTTGGKTPQQQAEDKVAAALLDYNQAIEKASLGMKEGYTSELDVKRKQLSAQERLYDAYGDAYNMYHDPKYKEAQDKAAEEIVKLQGELKASAEAQKKAQEAARELESAQKKLADAQQKLADAQATGSPTAIYKAQEEVSRQQGVVNGLQNPSLPVPARPTGFEAFKQAVQAEIKFDQMQVDENTLHSLLQTALQNGLDDLTVDYAGLQERIAKGIDIPESTWERLQEEINARLKELGKEPIKINFDTGNIEQVGKATKTASNEFRGAASAVSALGSALQQIDDPAAKVMGIIAQAIANVALTFASSLKGTVTPWDWIAAAIAGTATMITTIAAIHSATGYANGGIVDGRSGGFVGGMSYSGDNVGNVRLDSGELVLNRSQQNNLANALSNPMQDLQLSTRISAEDIEVVLNNRFSRSGYGEMLTSSDYY